MNRRLLLCFWIGFWGVFQAVWGQELPTLNGALREYETLSDSLKAFKLVELGNQYYMRGNDESYDQAANFYDKAMQIAREGNVTLVELMAMSRLAMVYETRGVYLEETLKMLLEGLKRIEKTKSKSGKHNFNNLISVIYTKLNRYEEALPYALKASAISEELKPYEDWKLLPTINLARIYGRLKQNEAAENQFLLAEKLCNSSQALRPHLNDVYRDWSAYEIANQRPKAAEALLQKWEAVLDTHQAALRLAWIHTHIEVAQLQKNWEKAARYWQAESELNRRIQSETARRQLQETFARMETHRKEIKILELQTENDRQRLWFFLSIAIAIFFAGAGLTMVVFLNQRKKLYEQQSQNARQLLQLKATEAQNMEREAMFLKTQNQLLAAENQLKEEAQTQAELRQQLTEAQLAATVLRLTERKAFVENIVEQLNEIKEAAPNRRVAAMEALQRTLKLDLSQSQGWEDFARYFEQTFSGFTQRLTERYPELTTKETKLACLIRAGRDVKDVADILGLAPESVHKARYRLKKKLNLPEEEDMDAVLSAL